MIQSQSTFRNKCSQQNVSFNHFRIFASPQATKRQIKAEERKIIKISPETSNQELQKIQWRIKTQFPIVKILSHKNLTVGWKNNNHLSSRKILVEVQIQSILYTLDDISQVPIFKVLYLIKQTVIATQRLCVIYGNFFIKPNMIGINQLNKCKIWHNSRFHLNRPQFTCQRQEETIKSVIDLFILKTKKSTISIQIFQNLQQCKTFCDMFKVLKKVVKTSKIKIPSSFQINDKFSSSTCSPRKYISRPPSNQKNPQNQLEKDLNSPKNSKSALFFKNKSLRQSPEKVKNQSTVKIKIFPSFLKRGRMISSQINKINPVRKDNVKLISPFPKKTQLPVIESLYQEDSDGHSINQIIERPRFKRILSIEIPRLSNNRNLQKQLCTSSLLTADRDSIEHDLTMFETNKNLGSTLDSIELINNKSKLRSIFDLQVKKLQKSFNNQE